MRIVETRGLTRYYGSRCAVESVDLSVPEGSLFGFLGPNGAGKSTTIRMLLGFLRPTSGIARVFGRDCWRDSRTIKAEIGYMPGDLRLYSWMNGHQALGFVSAARRRDVTKDGQRLAEEFGLDLSVRVRKMSRGMRQKLGLVLALAHRPRLLVLDEPTSGLDPLMQDQLHAHLRQMAATGHTVFFSSHTLSEVEELCDRVGIIREGKLIRDESLESLRRRTGHHVTIGWKKPGSMNDTPPPPCLTLEHRDRDVWRGALSGPVDDLIRWLAAHEVDDLIIARPDLETVFRRYYNEPTETS